MKFRVARHTDDLEQIIKFYKNILGLDIIGKFKNHNNYDGVFLGKKGLDWHLEFTKSLEGPEHKSDNDDLLVFYVETNNEYRDLKQRFSNEGLSPILSKNPYWNENGLTFNDPDGFRIVISIIKNN